MAKSDAALILALKVVVKDWLAVTDGAAGAVVSITMALLAPSDPLAAGDGSVRGALFPAVSFIDVPAVRALVLE